MHKGLSKYNHAQQRWELEVLKRCGRCKNLFPESEFGSHVAGRYGISSTCKKCSNQFGFDYRSRNRQKVNQERRERYTRNRDYSLVSSAVARCKRLNIPGIFTVEEWQELKASYGNRCAYCGWEAPLLCIDHLWPVSLARKGLEISSFATNSIENLIPTCSFCNLAKQDKPFIVFLAWKNGMLA